MAEFLLHGLWVQRSGLHLWIEEVDGHRIVLPASVPEGTFPPAVARAVAEVPFRHRLRATLRTPKGREVSPVIPTAAFGPAEALRLLSEFSFLDGPSPAATAEQRAAIAPDLLWLIRLCLGLDRLVAAGRVAIALRNEDGSWYPQWTLALNLEERSWLVEMLRAAPGILKVNNRNLERDAPEVLTHWLAAARLEPLAERSRDREEDTGRAWHDFAAALLRSEPARRGGAGLAAKLADWRESIARNAVQLVVIVEEPELDDESSDSEGTFWPVRLQARSGLGSPRPIWPEELDAASAEDLAAERSRAIKVSRLIDSAERGRARLLKRAPGQAALSSSADAGEWDAYLDTEEIASFVRVDAERLRRAGFGVMLPKSWAERRASARLVAKEAADNSPQSHFGLEQLVDYRWRVSVGDTELSDEEMKRLVASKSGLVKLRGEWVMADSDSLATVRGYLDRLASKADRAARQRLSELAQRARKASEEGAPDAEALAAELKEARRAYDEAQGAGGAVSLKDLREIAVESAGDDPVEVTGDSWFAPLLGDGGLPEPERVAIPDTVDATLRDYQRRGVDWLYWMSRAGLGAVLADDMGLGKTLQLLALLEVERSRGELDNPALVIAPTSVVSNWAAEARRFTPELKVAVHHGANRAGAQRLGEQAADLDLLITSYGVASRDRETLSKLRFSHVVLDEAQHVKNPQTRAAKAVRAIPADHRIALTGTPIENRLSEMRSILDFCNPGVLGSAQFFRHHFVTAIEKEHDEEMTERLRRLTAPFILRRLKTDRSIIDDLPDKTEQTITVRLTEEQAALYTSYVEDVTERISQREGVSRRGLVLSALTRIKQICNHPAHFLGDGSSVTDRGRHRSGKVDKLMELLEQAIADDERMLVFTQYRAFGDLLRPYLSNWLGEDVPFLHGGMSKQARDRLVERFQRDDGPRVMLLSLKAGGTGLNLTAASVVVHLDRWWNPAVEDQATDRAFRIGQRRDVRVYKLITAGTLEESIQEVLDGKTDLAGQVVGAGEGWVTELDQQDLERLMSYKAQEV